MILVLIFVLPVGCVSVFESNSSNDYELLMRMSQTSFTSLANTAEYYEYSDGHKGVQLKGRIKANSNSWFSINNNSKHDQILYFKNNSRIGHYLDDSEDYYLSFRCLSGTLSIEKYIGTKLPSYDIIKCTGQTEKFKISHVFFLELTTRYINSKAKIDNIRFNIL